MDGFIDMSWIRQRAVKQRQAKVDGMSCNDDTSKRRGAAGGPTHCMPLHCLPSVSQYMTTARQMRLKLVADAEARGAAAGAFGAACPRQHAHTQPQEHTACSTYSHRDIQPSLLVQRRVSPLLERLGQRVSRHGLDSMRQDKSVLNRLAGRVSKVKQAGANPILCTLTQENMRTHAVQGVCGLCRMRQDSSWSTGLPDSLKTFLALVRQVLEDILNDHQVRDCSRLLHGAVRSDSLSFDACILPTLIQAVVIAQQ